MSFFRSIQTSVQDIIAKPWTRWIGFRYLRSKKHSQFLSFITLISILGVGLGVTAMIVVLSVMEGFQGELKKRLTSTDLHVLMTPLKFDSELGLVSEEIIPLSILEKYNKKVAAVDAVLQTEIILRTEKKVSGIVVKGIENRKLERLSKIVSESASSVLLTERDGAETVRLPGMWIGQELAYDLGLVPGDPVTLVSPSITEGPMDSVPRLRRFVIEGVFKTGMPEQELQVAYTRMKDMRSFLRVSQGVTHWEITTHRFEDAPEIANELRNDLPQLKVQDWVQMNSHLFYSLKLERIAMMVILGFIVVVASFNIVTTLTLMVLEKRKEISILKAMGCTSGEMGAVFLSEGIFIGLTGIIGGTFFGGLICWLLANTKLIQLPEIYYDRTLPVATNWNYYVSIPLMAFFIVWLASLYPSYRAAQLHPMDGIRRG